MLIGAVGGIQFAASSNGLPLSLQALYPTNLEIRLRYLRKFRKER
jgi:hypothetical protein